jgi:nitroreductase
VDLETALRTTAAIREFDDRVVAPEVIFELLDTARFAPSGGNRQAWRVVVVRDPGQRELLGAAYRTSWYEYLAQSAAGLVPWAPVTNAEAEREAIGSAEAFRELAARGPGGMAEHLEDAPALLLLVADLRYLATVDRDLDRYTLVGGGSIYPFAWSLLLAARTHGLGGVLTTMVVQHEDDLREAFALEPHHCIAGLIVLGYPKHQPTKLRRESVSSFASYDRLDGVPVGHDESPTP